MDEQTSVIRLTALDPSTSKMVKRATKMREPVWVTDEGRVIAAVIDVESYNELVRLAEKGLIPELVAEAERSDAEGDARSWDEVQQEILEAIEQRARVSDG
jgi:hypothetical protein